MEKNMDRLWSPWRSKYIEAFKDEEKKKSKCIFCDAIETPENDSEKLVVVRRELCFAMLNKFPYNNGHFLIAPYRHIGEFDKLTVEEMTAIMLLINDSIKVLDHCVSPHGYNIGANIGREAGAGVPGHLHFHIVPRWNGDTSFMPLISETKVVSQALEDNLVTFSTTFKELFG